MLLKPCVHRTTTEFSNTIWTYASYLRQLLLPGYMLYYDLEVVKLNGTHSSIGACSYSKSFNHVYGAYQALMWYILKLYYYSIARQVKLSVWYFQRGRDPTAVHVHVADSCH